MAKNKIINAIASIGKTPEERDAQTKAELEKHGLAAMSQVKIEDPITGETRLINLDRTGMTEKKLILDLADPTLSRDRKDFGVSMYLYERGKESASFIADLMRYKGQHTKETRVFKSQMRFDFEMLVDMLAAHLREQALRTADILQVEVQNERRAFAEWLKLDNNVGKSLTYFDYSADYYNMHGIEEETGRLKAALVSQAMFDLEKADDLLKRRHSISEAREREKGKGIYLDSAGKPYLHDDPELDEALARDRELTADANKDV